MIGAERNYLENDMLRANTNLRRAPTEVLWEQTAAVEHSLQIYDDEGLFVDALEGFVSSGLRAGDGVIVIATLAHRRALERRLRTRGYDVDLARAQDRYIPVEAAAGLSEFMVAGWPDEDRFKQYIDKLLARAASEGRRARAFSEMVALLWSQGHNTATVRLESLWNGIIEQEALSLFCAYPRRLFTHDADQSILEICSHHSRLIPE
jgi:inosine/xanthosine triphosphate pyrophosphatase family protein